MRDETFKKLRSMWWVKCAGSDLCLGAIFMVMGLMIPMSGLLRMVDHWVNDDGQLTIVGTPIQMRALLKGGKFAKVVSDNLCPKTFGPEAYEGATDLTDTP